MQAAARFEAAKKKVAKGEGKASDCKAVHKQTMKTGKGRGKGRGRGKNKATLEEGQAGDQLEQHAATEHGEPQHHEAAEQREPQHLHEATEQREPQHHEAAEQRDPQHHEAAEPKAAAKGKTSRTKKTEATHTLSAAEAANQQLWNEQDIELCLFV